MEQDTEAAKAVADRQARLGKLKKIHSLGQCDKSHLTTIESAALTARAFLNASRSGGKQ